MASTPGFAATPRIPTPVAVATANTNRDGTGTIATLIQGVAAGTKINEIVVQATVTTTAGTVRFFLSVDSGTTWKLFDAVAIPAVTVSGTVLAARRAKLYDNLILVGTASRLGASTHNAEAFEVTALAADL